MRERWRERERETSANEVMVSRKMHQTGIHETILNKTSKMAFAEWALYATASIQFIHHQKFKKLPFLCLLFLHIFATEFHFHYIFYILRSFYLSFCVFSSIMSTYFLLHFYSFYLLVVCRNHYPLFVQQTKGETFRGFQCLCSSMLWLFYFFVIPGQFLSLFLFIFDVQNTARCYK